MSVNKQYHNYEPSFYDFMVLFPTLKEVSIIYKSCQITSFQVECMYRQIVIQSFKVQIFTCKHI